MIALLTDFGTGDLYVAEMKAAALAVSRALHVIDLTHAVRPHDVRMGAWQLRAASASFPEDTHFVAVVDPGVGTARAPIVMTSGNQVFIGPDNGLLWPAASRCDWLARRIERERIAALGGRRLSPTFHGRDLFAPVAALLASGLLSIAEVGPEHAPVRIELPDAVLDPGPPVRIVGAVLFPDRFGNVLTSVRLDAAIASLGRAPRSVHVFLADGASERASFVGTYADGPVGALVALEGSSGHVELAVSRGSAWSRHAEEVWSGARIELV